ncbi:hypothetical protein NEUTE2DRAFT_138445 [Neurospora tetrasperma FGSC 2509]|nr:hypothetical protein NEUTE2DRAFT_138445 [Neurospora tetrasperma FGSC 2509]
MCRGKSGRCPGDDVSDTLDVRRAARRAFGGGWGQPHVKQAAAGKHSAAYKKKRWNWKRVYVFDWNIIKIEYPSSKACLRSVPALRCIVRTDIQGYIPSIRQVGLPSILRRRTSIMRTALPTST